MEQSIINPKSPLKWIVQLGFTRPTIPDTSKAREGSPQLQAGRGVANFSHFSSLGFHSWCTLQFPSCPKLVLLSLAMHVAYC